MYIANGLVLNGKRLRVETFQAASAHQAELRGNQLTALEECRHRSEIRHRYARLSVVPLTTAYIVFGLGALGVVMFSETPGGSGSGAGGEPQESPA